MKYKKSIILLSLFALVSLLFLISVSVWHFRPLIPVRQWQIKAEETSGKPISVKTYRMLGRTMPLFLRIDSKWFIAFIDDDKTWVGSPNYPRTSPYLHFNHDMAYGVDILDGKMDEKWWLFFIDGTLVFSNTAIAVSVSPRE